MRRWLLNHDAVPLGCPDGAVRYTDQSERDHSIEERDTCLFVLKCSFGMVYFDVRKLFRLGLPCLHIRSYGVTADVDLGGSSLEQVKERVDER